jgi:hypothetical protein
VQGLSSGLSPTDDFPQAFPLTGTAFQDGACPENQTFSRPIALRERLLVEAQG